ncbi:hypothetical protein DUI87_06011 [Hirundo rustica rustica]|uniref:Uncharacterized protein n=1 Tax=Hirundo rustica rustica TaxID=333673 RepID=A0A3M0KVV2_HIRRU|nr:hypothetical protein DUI87_06011 [Hirundo rustica rustica]
MSSLLLLATPFLIQARMPLALLATRHILAPLQSAINQYPQVPFCLATVQPHHPQPVVLHGSVVAKAHLGLLNLISLDLVHLSMSLPEPSCTPADSPQLGAICKLADGELNPLIQIINKDTKQDWVQH